MWGVMTSRIQRYLLDWQGGLLHKQTQHNGALIGMTWTRTILGFVFLTPLSLFYFVAVDVMFMIFVLCTSVITFGTCGLLSGDKYLEFFDNLLIRHFGLTRMEVTGYRRMRTLSQLVFESFPQVWVSHPAMPQPSLSCCGVVRSVYNCIFWWRRVNLNCWVWRPLNW